jgi:RNA polymerase sigma-70 factor, ECF subfamily
MVNHLDDNALVAAAQGGDRNALDQLLRRHYDRIHAVCARVAGGSRDADDACQEALIKIVRSLPRFDGRSTFSTWAYRIAMNASLDELRKRNRRPTLHTADEEHRPEAVDPDAAAPIDQFSDRLLLDDALADAEIAETLDIPIGTVKSRISRGRAALADTLRLEGRADGRPEQDLPELDDLDGPWNQIDLDERPTDQT